MLSAAVAVPATASPDERGETRAIIAFRSIPPSLGATIIERGGGAVDHRYRLVPALAARLPSRLAFVLALIPGVTVERDALVAFHGERPPPDWGVRRVAAPAAHAAGMTGAGARVGIVDTGIDAAHPEIASRYAGGYDFVHDDTDPYDDNNHGTHIAGIVAAADDGVGVTGVAPGVTLFAYKVLDVEGRGYWSDVIAALDAALDPNGDGDSTDRLDVVNLSLGTSRRPGSTVRSAFARAYGEGLLMVAAAGNFGNRAGEGDTVAYPARLPSVIAVAATDPDDMRTESSSTGPTVELAAPGINITSARAGGGYFAWNGTSLAAPHVVGLAALIVDEGVADEDGDGRTNDDVRMLLRAAAVDLGEPGRDRHYGFGLARIVPGG